MNNSSLRIRPQEIALILALLLLAVSLAFHHATGSSGKELSSHSDAGLESALLHEEWPKVANRLAAVTAATPSPVSRMLKGHALLALNRNNESTALFQTLSTARQRAVWRSWAMELAVKTPNEAISHYLAGDAAAREGDWTMALSSLSLAITLKPRSALALSARGVVHGHNCSWGEAINDLNTAISAAPTLADPYANRGYLNIARKSGAAGARDWFSKALAINPQFSLALLGRGMISLMEGDAKAGARDLEQARASGTAVAGILAMKLVEVNAQLRGMDRKRYLQELAGVPGTTLDKKYSDLVTTFTTWKKNPDKQFGPNGYNDVHNRLSNLPADKQDAFINNVIGPAFAKDTRLAQSAARAQQKVADWIPGSHVASATTHAALTGAGSAMMKVPHPAAVGGGIAVMGGGAAARAMMDNQTKQTSLLNDKLQPLTRRYAPSGGVSAQPVNPHIDDGQWPITPVYGLLFELPGKE